MMMGVYLIILCLISAEVSKSDGIPDSSSSDISVTTSSTTSMRRLTLATGSNGNLGRDTKLMSVLAARRHALVRNRGMHSPRQNAKEVQQQHVNESNGTTEPISQRSQCEKNCTSNFTTRATAGCMRKCVVQYKIGLSSSSSNRSNDSSLIIRSRNKINDGVANTITEELLDTEESQTNGLYYDNNSRNRYALNTSEAKDQNHSINVRNNYKHNVIENEVRQSSTEKIYLKLLRTNMDARHKRVEPSRGLLRHRASSTTISYDKSDENSEPYLYFGQKIVPLKLNESKNFVTPIGGPSTISTKSSNRFTTDRGELDNGPAVKLSSSPERNKFRRFNPQTRNIVALNRKYGGVIPKSILDGTSNSSTVLFTKDSNKIKIDSTPEIIPDSKLVNQSSHAIQELSLIKDLEPVTSVAEPILFNNQSVELVTQSVLLDRTTAVDLSVNDSVTKSNESTIVQLNTSTTATMTERSVIDSASESSQSTTETIISPIIGSDSPKNVPIEAISNDTSLTLPQSKDEILTTSRPSQLITQKINYTPHHPDETPNLILFLPPKDMAQVNESIKINESRSNEKPHDITDTPITSVSFTKTTISSSIRSTINLDNDTVSESTVAHQFDPVTTAPTSRNASVPFYSPSNTTSNSTYFNLSSMFPNFSGIKSNVPTLPDLTLILTPSFTQTSQNPPIVADEVLLSTNNDVTIEMHRMNMATYVLAGLGTLPIIIIALYVIRSLIFKKNSKCDDGLESYQSDNHKPISPVVRLEDSCQSSCYDEESIMTEQTFNRNQLKFKSLLGEGNFGQVWKAEADDLAGHLGTTRIVAVKTERCTSTCGGLKDEAKIMKKLGSHPNVVTLLGACIEKEPHLLIMEFAMRGKLLSLLRTAKNASMGSSTLTLGEPNMAPLSSRRLAGFALDIARGMEYIAEKRIVHRDLAARNVLLDHNGVCKICDFGMSIDLDNAEHSQKIDGKSDVFKHHTTSPESHRFRFDFNGRAFGIERKAENCRRPALPIRWMAPEALQYHIFSPETDVWAFGIVLWEIATLGCTPYPALSGREVVRNVPNGTRPEIPIDCRPELYDLMTRSWCKDPRQRPTFNEARIELARCLCQWEIEDNSSDYLDVSGFSEDLEHGVVYFNRRISEFECEI